VNNYFKGALSYRILLSQCILLVCQTAVEQHKVRQSLLKVDASKITEQLKIKRAQLAAYEKEKHDLKRSVTDSTDEKNHGFKIHQTL